MMRRKLWPTVVAVAIVLGGPAVNAAGQTGGDIVGGSSRTSLSGPSSRAGSPAAAPTSPQARRRGPHLKVCGNPQVACKTAIKFKPYDLPFQMPATAVIYDTDLFYAIILQSVKTPNDDCDTFVSERDRLAAQALFPDHKVFSSRCVEPGEVGYSNTNDSAHFMAVYGGMTLAEANRMLARVQATGKFSGANIRRMRAMINGT